MGLTNFPNGVSSFGVTITGTGIPATFGNIYFVDATNGSDGNNGKSMKKAFKTITKAYDTTTTNNNDIILLSGYATHTLTAMLTVAKNRIHFIGLDCGNRRYGQRTKVSLGVTTAATDIATLKVTGVGCTFRNIKFMNSNTVAQGIYCVVDAGEYSIFESCEFYKDTDLDVTGAAELVANGDSSLYRYCTFGSTVNAISGAIRRGCVVVTREIITGKVARDVSFERCIFWRKAGNTANCFVNSTTATDIERMMLFDDCVFFNTKLAAAAPAQAIICTSAQTEGFVLVRNCTGVNITAFSTSTGIVIDGAVPTYATTGIAVAS